MSSSFDVKTNILVFGTIIYVLILIYYTSNIQFKIIGYIIITILLSWKIIDFINKILSMLYSINN